MYTGSVKTENVISEDVTWQKKKTHAKYAKTKKIKSIPILGTHMELGEL